jgi:hypothetical protein
MRAISVSSRQFQPLPTLVLFVLTCCSLLPAQDSNAPDSALGTTSLARPLITQPVDEAQLTVLRGNTHPLARREFDLGTAPASLPLQRMLLVLKRSPEQEHALRTLLDDQQDKGSPNYHKWLTPEQFGRQFGPTDLDLQTITGWLQSHGFQVGSTKGRTVLEFSGSASQVQEAFHTAIHKYVVKGEQHWANASDPAIPAALTPAVSGVLTLHNFLKKPLYVRPDKKFSFTHVAGKPPEFTSDTGLHALAPADYAVIYNINPLYQAAPAIDGTGTTIAVIGRSDIVVQDVADFRFSVGLPSNPVTPLLNGPDPGDVPGDDFEGTLDATWSGAVAPGATVDFVISASTDTTDGVDLSLLYIVENNLANVMTESFGGCEFFTTQSDADGLSAIAEQGAAQGISYMASTGDAGATGCDNPNFETVATFPVSVNLPATTPFTTAVGGTIFNENGNDSLYWSTTNDATTFVSALSYIPEDVWNESCTSTSCGGNANIAAGGGGASTFFSKPTWQSALTGAGDGSRDIPDVSLTAAIHDLYLLCFQQSCPQGFFVGAAGTSASAPSFAGIMALVDQKMGIVQGPPAGARQGLANYVLYNLAIKETFSQCNGSTGQLNSACVFNDITVGNNEVPGEPGYPSAPYNSSAGYDLATGLGSVNVNNLVNGWANETFRATITNLTLNSGTTLVTIVHGQSVNVGISVAPGSGTGTPKGNVSLVAATSSSGQGVPPTAGFKQQVFTLNAGSVAGATTQLPGGDYTVVAHYAGDGTFAPSESAPGIPVAVTAENSTTTETVQAFDQNGNPLPLTSIPFGSFVFVKALVAGKSGSGIPTGMVTFTDTCNGTPCNLPGQIFNPVANPVALNSTGDTSIGGGVVNFDASDHSISAAYGSDPSFSSSQTVSPVTFTIQPGFAGISGPTDVTITNPGLSGTSTVGIITSTGFTTPISFTCSGLPVEAACVSTPVTGTGPNTPVNATITVTTMGPHTTMLQPTHQPYYWASIFGGLPLAGLFLLGSPRRRKFGTVLGLMMLALLITLPACGGGGGGGGGHQQDPGTPTGTTQVTVTATAGSLSAQSTFFLTVK